MKAEKIYDCDRVAVAEGFNLFFKNWRGFEKTETTNGHK